MALVIFGVQYTTLKCYCPVSIEQLGEGVAEETFTSQLSLLSCHADVHAGIFHSELLIVAPFIHT